MAAILALKREKRSLVQATPALERLVETIGEPTPQSQELREETEARVTASAAAVPTLPAKRQRKLPVLERGSLIDVATDYNGELWWCPGTVTGVLSCLLDGSEGKSFYVVYETYDDDSQPADAWIEQVDDLYKKDMPGGWRLGKEDETPEDADEMETED